MQLRGELNVAALQQAIKGVFNRYDAFHLQIDRSPLQAVAEDLEIQVPFTDLSASAEEQQTRQLKSLFKKLGSTPYDLERGPLAHFHLVRLQPQLHLLLASAHHIVCDGWSWNHVLTELGQLYRALKLGGEHGLEEPTSFTDYARELAANTADADESLAYWLEQYRELPGPLELPVDRQRLPVKSYRGSTLVYEFDSEVLRLVRQAASRSKVSLFSFVFTAFNVLLSRLSSQTDIVVTVPTAGQLAYGMPGLVGHCVNLLQAMKQRPGMQAEDTLLAITTLSFDISILEIFLPLIVGARLIIADRDVCLDGRLLSSLMAKEKVSVMQATPATWQLLIHSGWEGRSNLKILCGGEALSIALAKELTSRGKSLWNMYGPTETTIWSSVAEVRDSDSLIDLGHPIANTIFFVLDSQLAPVPYGVAGNLYIGGEGLALGYWNQELLTREKFIRDPFSSNSRIYDTGDVVRRLANGGFEYLGRRDSQVKVRGFRIELGEIENALKQRSEVNDACVIARPTTSAESELVAYVVGDPGKALDPAIIRSGLRSSLPEYMIPSHFVLLDALPLTPNHKVDRRRLPMPSPTRDVSQSQAVGPRTENERRIIQAFERVLGRANIGLDDNFFDLGGHSLAAARLLSEIEKIHGKRLPLAMLLQAPTPRLIALELDGKEHTQWNSMVPISARGGLPPLYCIHAAGGNVLLYRDLARHLGDDQPVYGLQSDALQSGVPKAQTVEEMASAYAQEIIANQTHGPIHLCGYCLGGSIAYEVAQQLTQLGHQVGLVALFDTHSNWLQEEKGSRRYQQIKFHLENLALSGFKGNIGFLGAKLQEANRRFSRKVASQTSRAAFRLGIRKAPPVHVLDHIYDLASEEYIAQPYEGRVVVFKPKQAYAGYEDASLGWCGLVEDLDVIELPVYPAGILVEPFVQQLATLLRKCLDEATTKPETRHNLQETSTGELLWTN